MIVLSDYFLFSWNNLFFGEKDYSLNLRRVLQVIFSPSEIQAKMIISCHSSSVIVLFPFNFPITTDFLMAWYVQNNRSLSTELSREGGGGVDRVVTTTASRTPLFLCLPMDTDTVDTRVHVWCHLIHDLWCKRLGKVSNFTGSNAVPFFFPEYEFSFFDFSGLGER